jgi:hypothetical protein
MATVRFSTELSNAILASARNKMQPAIDRAEQSKPDNAWGQTIYDTLFNEVKPYIAKLPAGWLRTVDKIEIEKVGGVECNMTFTFATFQPWPHTFIESDFAKKNSSSYSGGLILRGQCWDAFQAEVVAFNQRKADAQKRRAEFVDMVKKIIEAYSTLGPALKAWPPLWDLIPENVKNKHREIKERTKNEVVLDIDIDKLTAMSTAAKFGV